MEIDFTPRIVSGKTDKTINELLAIPRKRKIICFHKWVYWRLGMATSSRRVCTKCFKKQQDRDVVTGHHKPLWIKDKHYN